MEELNLDQLQQTGMQQAAQKPVQETSKGEEANSEPTSKEPHFIAEMFSFLEDEKLEKYVITNQKTKAQRNFYALSVDPKEIEISLSAPGKTSTFKFERESQSYFLNNQIHQVGLEDKFDKTLQQAIRDLQGNKATMYEKVKEESHG